MTKSIYFHSHNQSIFFFCFVFILTCQSLTREIFPLENRSHDVYWNKLLLIDQFCCVLVYYFYDIYVNQRSVIRLSTDGYLHDI